MPSKKPTKAEVVNKTKRANNRLKVIGETCLDLAQGRDSRLPERVHKLLAARLDRELTPSDTAGPSLRAAVEAFWQSRDSDSAMAVYTQVRQVQSERWLQVEAKYGKVSHYFDDFGQIKPRYRSDSQEAKHPRWPFVLMVALASLVAWWLW